MNLNQAISLLLASNLGIVAVAKDNDKMDATRQAQVNEYMQTLAMVGAPVGSSSPYSASSGHASDNLRGSGREAGRRLTTNESQSSSSDDCTDLDEFPQWNQEVGYWIGEYTLLQGDGTYNVNPNWPYPYDAYTGFITGNVVGNSYRQRNVFLYPPQSAERCAETGDAVSGGGTCGVNGNSLVFAADQTGCSSDGSISGSFEIDFGAFQVPVDTTTELVGDDNALLYQVSSSGFLTQSQLTTLVQDGNTRVRTAQSFAFGSGDPAGTSYYRERKVTEEEFYTRLNEVISTYNIREEDLCYLNGFNRIPVDGYTPGAEQCRTHLEQTFMLGEEDESIFN